MQRFTAPLAPPTRPGLGRVGQFLACALTAASALSVQAQTAPVPAQAPTQVLEQKAERLTHEDEGSRIEELRVGGQTRSIDVQTKSAVPAYQVQPLDAGRAPDSTGPGSQPEGKSSWRLLKF